MVMDDHLNGVPVAWSIQSNETEATILSVLSAWKTAMEAVDPDFNPPVFVIDDASATINVIK